jgi:hypothetical protein
MGQKCTARRAECDEQARIRIACYLVFLFLLVFELFPDVGPVFNISTYTYIYIYIYLYLYLYIYIYVCFHIFMFCWNAGLAGPGD